MVWNPPIFLRMHALTQPLLIVVFIFPLCNYAFIKLRVPIPFFATPPIKRYLSSKINWLWFFKSLYRDSMYWFPYWQTCVKRQKKNNAINQFFPFYNHQYSVCKYYSFATLCDYWLAAKNWNAIISRLKHYCDWQAITKENKATSSRRTHVKSLFFANWFHWIAIVSAFNRCSMQESVRILLINFSSTKGTNTATDRF